jgi:PAS domain S-box-containing protein
VHPDDLPGLEDALAEHLRGDSPHLESEHRIRHETDSYRWFLARRVAIRNRGGKPTRIAGSMSDITARKAAEEVLRQNALTTR